MSQAPTVLVCDLVGLALDADGRPDPSEVRRHIEVRGGEFHTGPLTSREALAPGKIHFFYLPGLNTGDEVLAAAQTGNYDAVIAAATQVPEDAQFPLGGVRIGAGTGNMRSKSWGGSDGIGGPAPLMNTPGFNTIATAQMVMKAILSVTPDLPVDRLHDLTTQGLFDTGRDLPAYPTVKLEGRCLAVVGYGNIGRAVAKLGSAFGLDVCVAAGPRHREWIEAEGYRYAETAARACEGADIVSLHVGLGTRPPGSEVYSNTHLIGADEFDAMRPGSILINYDRGEVVDVAALDDAISRGVIEHAFIDADIFVDPSTKAVSGPLAPYIKLARRHAGSVHVLPHAAADTDHPSRVSGACKAVDQIYDAIENKVVVNVKGDIPQGYRPGVTTGPRGVSRIDAQGLATIFAEEALLDQLKQATATMASAWDTASQLTDDGERKSFFEGAGHDLMKSILLFKSRLEQVGVFVPFAI